MIASGHITHTFRKSRTSETVRMLKSETVGRAALHEHFNIFGFVAVLPQVAYQAWALKTSGDLFFSASSAELRACRCGPDLLPTSSGSWHILVGKCICGGLHTSVRLTVHCCLSSASMLAQVEACEPWCILLTTPHTYTHHFPKKTQLLKALASCGCFYTWGVGILMVRARPQCFGSPLCGPEFWKLLCGFPVHGFWFLTLLVHLSQCISSEAWNLWKP